MVSACGKKEDTQTNPPPSSAATPSISNRAAQEITNRIREPQNRARQAQEMVLQADQRARNAVDEASR